MDTSFLVPVALFAMIAAIVIMPGYIRSRDRERLHETLRLAFEKGQPVPPELIAALQSSKTEVTDYAPLTTTAERDLRRGVIWTAVGLGCVVIGACFFAAGSSFDHSGIAYNEGAGWTFASFAAIGAIPGFIGLAFLALWFFNRKRPS